MNATSATNASQMGDCQSFKLNYVAFTGHPKAATLIYQFKKYRCGNAEGPGLDVCCHFGSESAHGVKTCCVLMNVLKHSKCERSAWNNKERYWEQKA